MSKRSLVVAAALAVSMVGSAFGKVYWVSPSGNDFPGWQGVATVDKTFTTIKAALADADLAAEDTVVLDKCTFDLSYNNRANEICTTVDITKRITITGVGTKSETILDGGEECTGGRRWAKYHYPGFKVKANDVVFKNMTMTRMGSEDSSTTLTIENNYTGCRIENVVFRDTGVGYTTWKNFTGIVMTGNKDTVLSGCSFIDNKAPSCVLYASGTSKMRVENCYFSGNTCTKEKHDYGVIYANFGSGGDGWFCNNTVVGNKSASGAVYHAGSGCRIVNNIIYGNTDLDGVEAKNACQGGGSATMWTYNCIGEDGSSRYTGEGNIFRDPGLADDKLHLSSARSPCYMAANATYAPTCDIEGVTRDATSPCMGCSEYINPAKFTCLISATSKKVTLPETVTLSVAVAGTTSGTLTYAWDFESDGTVDATTPTAVLNKEGRFNVTVVVTDQNGSGDSAIAKTDSPIYVYGVGNTRFTWYVSPTGTGKNPVAGFASGFKTIKAALTDSDLADGDTILLDTCTFDMSSAGGRGDISTKKDAITKRVTISGAGTREQTILDGGSEWDRRNSGQGAFYPQFYVNANGVTIRNMTFERMGSNGDAAIEVVNGKTDCVVSNIIIRNTGWGYTSRKNGKGHINVGNQNTKVMCSVFSNNCTSCALVYLMGNANAGIENCYFAENSCIGTDGGVKNGVVQVGAGCLRNNTIVNNKTAIGAVYHTSSSSRIVNNIIYGNTDLDGVEAMNAQIAGGSVTMWTYNCLGEGSGVFTGDGNIFKDPALADDNLHLDSSSPCISAASATYAPATDIDGIVRDAAKPCIGCSEFVSQVKYTCAIKATSEKVMLPATVTLSVEITGTPSGKLTYAWDFEGDGTVDATTATAVLNKVGRYHVSVTVRDEGGSGDPVFASYDNPIYVYGKGKTNFTWYVSPSGNGKNPAASFASGFPTIKAALKDEDLTDGDTILLDTCRFDMGSAGGRGDISTRDDAITKRITISGAGAKEETVLDGGEEWDRRNSGQGKFYPQFYVKANGVTIRNLTLERMGSNGDAAIEVLDTVTDCVVSNIIIRNTGWGYTTQSNGKGHINTGGRNTKVLCSVFSNNCISCSLVYLQGNANPCVENCYFASNTCFGAASANGTNGVVCTYAGFFRNNTVVNNRTPAGAICHYSGTVVNNIVFGNTDLKSVRPKDIQRGTAANWTYNCLGEGSAVYTGAGNIFVDPGLAADRLHLNSALSPCVGTASAASAPAVDIDGVKRFKRPCMGCSEYVGSSAFAFAVVPPVSPYVSRPATMTLSTQITGTAVEPLAYAWDLNGDGVVDSTEAEPVLSEPGRYEVSVTVTDGAGNDARAELESVLLVYPEVTAGADEKVFYVLGWENPNAREPFTNWVTAANSIKGAYTNAVQFAASKIMLGDGVFPVTSTMTLTNGMVVTSLNGRDKTMLTRPDLGGGVGMFVINDPTSVIERVTLCGAGPSKASNAHGAAVNFTAGILRDCVVSNFCKSSNYGTLKIQANTKSRPVRIERCSVSDNTASGSTEAAVYLAGYATIENCLFKNNVGSKTGSIAFHNYSWNSVIRNCTFADNHTVDTMPVLFKANPSVFENNIITGCTTNNRENAANDVLYYDTNKSAFQGPISAIRYSCIRPAGWDYSGKEGVITTKDPNFVAAGDYHLDPSSPCRNAGINNGVYTADSKDLDGNPRLVGIKVDLGCYECQKIPGMILIVR